MREEEGRRVRLRLLWLRGLLVVVFLIVLARLVDLQVIRTSLLTQRAEQQRLKIVAIEGERGTIVDRKGRVLVYNREASSVYATPSAVADPHRTAARLAPILGLSLPAIAERLTAGRPFVFLARRVPRDEAARVKALGVEGIGQLMEWERVYPHGPLLANILGFTGLDNRGLEGLERRYDTDLAGSKGSILQEQDAMGRPVLRKDFQYGSPSLGKDLVLTIDQVIQHIAERELDEAVRAHRAISGTVIVMVPRTGEVLAMASRPTYNPNAVRRHQPDEWRNRAITDPYEPGSTFKVFVAAAALQAGIVTPEELIDCERGKAEVGGAVLHDHSPLGLLTFAEVVQKSSNIGMAKVALRLGDRRFADAVRAFGFGARTGLDLPGESPGVFRDLSDWSRRSLATLSIGQEVSATPIQLVTAVSAVANGGLLMRPYVVAEVRGPDGKVLRRTLPMVRARVFPERIARQLTRILQGVMAPGGTGERAILDGYTAAGKTGTAQKLDPQTRAYTYERSVSSFVGYLPAEDAQAVILVVIDEPKGRGWGGQVAAPVFQKVAMQVAQYLKVPSSADGRILLVAR